MFTSNLSESFVSADAIKRRINQLETELHDLWKEQVEAKLVHQIVDLTKGSRVIPPRGHVLHGYIYRYICIYTLELPDYLTKVIAEKQAELNAFKEQDKEIEEWQKEFESQQTE